MLQKVFGGVKEDLFVMLLQPFKDVPVKIYRLQKYSLTKSINEKWTQKFNFFGQIFYKVGLELLKMVKKRPSKIKHEEEKNIVSSKSLLLLNQSYDFDLLRIAYIFLMSSI